MPSIRGPRSCPVGSRAAVRRARCWTRRGRLGAERRSPSAFLKKLVAVAHMKCLKLRLLLRVVGAFSFFPPPPNKLLRRTDTVRYRKGKKAQGFRRLFRVSSPSFGS